MDHPAFAEAGANPGLEIWSIEQFEPVPYDTKLYGKFYNGDSYIVLKTTGEKNSTLSYDAHFWLGSKTTQDKKGSAAIWTVTLDDMLGGRAVHHREVQGHESGKFVEYFYPAIRYLEGGSESGFNQVETNAGAEKRLLRLSGCDNMRIEEVPADASSLTKDNCFILEVGHDIFVLVPEGAKATHRRNIINTANSLRWDEHNGRATIEIIDEFSCDEEIAAFFEALGSGCKEDMADDDTSDDSYARDGTTVHLYKVLAGDELELVALSKPYKQKHLTSEDVYVLDTPCSGIYLWLGKDVDPDIKKNYYEIAQKYLEVKGYPSWVHVSRVSEGVESCYFKQYFHNWDSVNAVATRSVLSESESGYFSEDVEASSAAAKYIGKSAAARAYMPDDGDGTLKVIMRISGDKDDVTEVVQESPVLYQSEAYVLVYQYTNQAGEEAHLVYWWIGMDANDDDKKESLQLVSEYEEELREQNVTIIKIPQGKETRHFLSVFKGALVILMGNKEDEYKPDNSNKSYDDDNVRLFRVEGTELDVDMRAVQVPETADTLEDDDVFVLETKDFVYLRVGQESDPKEREAALGLVERLVGCEKEIVVVEQGEEPEEFWEPLGGKPDEEGRSGWQLAASRRVNSPPEMSAASVKLTGKIKFEDLSSDYLQRDLASDGLYILDTGEELYLWQGKDLPERVKVRRSDIVQEYIKDDGMDRTADTALVITLQQGNEPDIFKKLFTEWDDDFWQNQLPYEEMKKQAMESSRE